MLNTMRMLRFLIALAFPVSSAFAQVAATAPAFEVASVRASQRQAGPDYNNQITYGPASFTARNATLLRLVAEAWNLQMNQVIGPAWLSRNEYDIEARSPEGAGKEQMALLLQGLLAERFHVQQHSESRTMRAYELLVGKAGSKFPPIQPGAASDARSAFHFRGDMRQFADLLAVQFSIPASDDPAVPARAGGPPVVVLDKTGLHGIYEFSVDLRPELHTDVFTAWNRVLQDQLGLKVESRKAAVPVVVVDEAARVPTEN